jgi:hypothetical protein
VACPHPRTVHLGPKVNAGPLPIRDSCVLYAPGAGVALPGSTAVRVRARMVNAVPLHQRLALTKDGPGLGIPAVPRGAAPPGAAEQGSQAVPAPQTVPEPAALPALAPVPGLLGACILAARPAFDGEVHGARSWLFIECCGVGMRLGTAALVPLSSNPPLAARVISSQPAPRRRDGMSAAHATLWPSVQCALPEAHPLRC